MLTDDTTTAPVMSSATKTKAAVAKADTVTAGPMMSVCAARPASSGPVQPNPANRYPKPYITSPRAGFVALDGSRTRPAVLAT